MRCARLKVDRDDAAFGDPDNQAGYLDSWAAGRGDGMGWFEDAVSTELNPIRPQNRHNGWKYEGITQFTPYWEGLDGRLKVELSLFQNAWNGDGFLTGTIPDNVYTYYKDDTVKYRSRNNGIGSGSFRVQWAPVEDLTLTASAINFRSRKQLGWAFQADNNTAVNFAFRYTPRFLDRLTVWGQYVHGWNVDNISDQDSDVTNLGASFALTPALTLFAQGDYLRVRDPSRGYRDTGWAFYTGMTYEMPMGAIVEAGWRREMVKTKQSGTIVNTIQADTVYANVGFEF